MDTVEKIKVELRFLARAEKIAIHDWLGELLEDESEFTDEFKAKIEKGESDFRMEFASRQQQLSQSFEKPDAHGPDTVGEEPIPA